MDFAFLLFRYFPHGGLQRDALAVAGRLAAAGERVRFVVGSWDGPQPAGIAVEAIGRRGWTNHGADADFARRALPAAAAGGGAFVVGFNRMPGLDAYYGGDPCLAARLAARPAWQRLMPRNRRRLAFERAVFGPASATRSLLLSPGQQRDVVGHYGTPADRLLLLPPASPATGAGRRTGRRGAAPRAPRSGWRRARCCCWRSARATPPRASTAPWRRWPRAPPARRGGVRLAVAGRGRDAHLRAQAARLGIADRLLLLGPRDDVPALLLAADLLVHPARLENTGQAILEAVVAGLPVLATVNCGFAPHLERAGAGLVLAEPFHPAALARALGEMLDPARLAAWSAAALAYAGREDLHGGLDAAAAALRRWAAQR
ncbi:MAG: glycosyltransferase family 4 protein [Dongiaceae bacterium]